ncbi:MAG: hypothetical protein ACRCVI_02850 [Mycoplasmoidaceae bacterium]
MKKPNKKHLLKWFLIGISVATVATGTTLLIVWSRTNGDDVIRLPNSIQVSYKNPSQGPILVDQTELNKQNSFYSSWERIFGVHTNEGIQRLLNDFYKPLSDDELDLLDKWNTLLQISEERYQGDENKTLYSFQVSLVIPQQIGIAPEDHPSFNNGNSYSPFIEYILKK